MRILNKVVKFVVTMASVILLSGIVLSASAYAQTSTMTVEELEQFIAEKKLALELARKNREMNEQKAADIKEQLAAKELDQEKLLMEMKELCTERNEVEPGSYDACMDQLPSN